MSGGPLLLIGEFARRCRLPVSTLRYYDRIGLLTPAVVDRRTGYRGYHPDQVPVALLVARLRAIGTVPERIAAVVGGGDRARDALAAERQRLRDRISQQTRALAELDELLAPAPLPRAVMLLRQRVAVTPLAADHDRLRPAVLRGIATLRTALRRAGAAPVEPWGALLPLDVEQRVSGVVFVRVDGPMSGLDTVELPVGRGMQVDHHRAPESAACAYAVVLDAVARSGGVPRGPVVEEYPAAGPSVRISVPTTGSGW